MAAAVVRRPKYRITHADVGQEITRNTTLRRRYRAVDFAVMRFLHDLGEYRESLVRGNRGRFGWLLRFRDEFRCVIADEPCRGLEMFLGVCPPEHPSFLVGVWLLGRCASRHASYELDRLPADGDARSRRHFARALRRLESWPRLRQLAADYPDDLFVQAMLERPHRHTFVNRLHRFAEHIDQSHADEAALASRMPLWFRDADWKRTEPKRPSWIRVFLERIRQWVHGE